MVLIATLLYLDHAQAFMVKPVIVIFTTTQFIVRVSAIGSRNRLFKFVFNVIVFC